MDESSGGKSAATSDSLSRLEAALADAKCGNLEGLKSFGEFGRGIERKTSESENMRAIEQPL
jgi:hypothetical protein